MPQQFLFKEMLLKEIAKTKGMVNCHAHLDRAYTLTEENFALSNALMEEKWVLNRDIKKAHTRESLIKRFEDAIALFMEQGIIACRTFVDADNIVDMLCINTAAEMREKYKGKFILQLAPQPLEGFLNADATKSKLVCSKKHARFVMSLEVCLQGIGNSGTEAESTQTFYSQSQKILIKI